MLPKNVLYYGQDQPLPQRRELRAGPLSLVYEAGDLRYIRLDDREILRRVYVAVRDRNWGTVPATLSDLRLEVADDWFRIAYDAEHRQGEINFAWRGTIVGDARGTITFTMDGQARSTFLRNRIGFCVLHPIRECAGRPCTVELADGTIGQGQFPAAISPHQPLLELRAIGHEVAPGIEVEVRFAGDIFEMEDQRNWTDASYKTYCTPLRLPFPVEVSAGTTVSQSVRLTIRGGGRSDTPRDTRAPDSADLTFIVGQANAGPLPRIGLGVASHGQPLGPQEVARLEALGLAHLRVDLNLSQPDYRHTLRRAAGEARALGRALECAIFLSDAATDELSGLVAALEEVEPPVCRWLVFHSGQGVTPGQTVQLARQSLSSYDPATPIGGGTDAYFTQLNRARPPTETLRALDLICYSINPQVHAFDNASLVETLAAQAATVESARRFCAGRPLAITPVTLKPRFNPDATGAEPESAPDQLPPQVDPRQPSLFGAGWTAGSLKYLSESGVTSVTYYETSGPRGVLGMAAGSVFPLYHVLADVGEFAGGEVVPSTSSDPLLVEGLALRKGGEGRVILANLGPEPRRVTVRGLGGRVRVRRLDETNAERAMVAPEAFRREAGETLPATAGALEIDLRPYAVARLDTIP